MRAGELALGVWLPIALADIIGWIAAGATMGEVQLEREKVLSAWGLTDLAKAVANDAERARAEEEDNELMASFERFAKIVEKRNR